LEEHAIFEILELKLPQTVSFLRDVLSYIHCTRNASCALNLISTFYYYHWVDTSAGGLLVPAGIICPVVSASSLTWFIRYIYYWNLQFL